MKRFFLIYLLGFAFGLAPLDFFAGGVSGTAEAQAVCAGQKITNNWFFTASNSRTGVRKVYGPYRCRAACNRSRSGQTGKAKWTAVGACGKR